MFTICCVLKPQHSFWHTADYKQNKIESSLHYTRGITPKRVTSGEAHLRNFEVAAVASRWQHCVKLTDPGFEPQTSRTDSVCV